MNRNQIVMASIGGAALAAALALGFFVFSAFGERDEAERSLESYRANVRSVKSGAVAPTESAIKAIEENRGIVEAWRLDMMEAASEGDMLPPEAVTPPAFRQRMAEDARALARLPGSVDGCIAAETQGFGFPDFVKGGKMPSEDELPRLQRQWSDICFTVKLLSKCGVGELVSIAPVEKTEQAKEKEEAAAKQRPGARNQRGRRPAEKKELASTQKYAMSFRARPAAFIRFLNALGTCKDRFASVDGFDFRRPDDSLATLLGGGKDAGAAAGQQSSRPGSGGRGSARAAARARSAQAAASEEGEPAKKGLVTDPAAVLLDVTLRFTIYDFGTGADKAAAASAAKDVTSGKEDAQ